MFEREVVLNYRMEYSRRYRCDINGETIYISEFTEVANKVEGLHYVKLKEETRESIKIDNSVYTPCGYILRFTPNKGRRNWSVARRYKQIDKEDDSMYFWDIHTYEEQKAFERGCQFQKNEQGEFLMKYSPAISIGIFVLIIICLSLI